MTTLLFYVFGATALGAAVMSVSRKNLVSSAVWLVVMFFGLASTYVLLEAYFVAAVQVLVYAGAIMVLFLFVIMLLDLRTETLAHAKAPSFPVLGVLTALGFLLGAGVAVWNAVAAGIVGGEVAELAGGAREIGGDLFEKWLLAFEVTSVLLLGAILGAVILTKRRLT